jgi:hypothetical protein
LIFFGGFDKGARGSGRVARQYGLVREILVRGGRVSVQQADLLVTARGSWILVATGRIATSRSSTSGGVRIYICSSLLRHCQSVFP